jgi:hypothetical protein
LVQSRSTPGIEAGMNNGSIETLRVIRAWHYSKAQYYAERAAMIEKRIERRLDRKSTSEQTAIEFRGRSSEHLRFVRMLNEFFDPKDRIT